MSEGKVIGTVGFSVDGSWLTKFIRNRVLREDGSYEWAVETIKELLKCNELTDQQTTWIAQNILMSRGEFKGNTRDGTFVYCKPDEDEPAPSFLFERFCSVKNTARQLKEEIDEVREAWQELALVLKGEMSRSDCVCQCNIDLLKPTPAEEFIDRMIASEEETAPYGFIAPDGTLHEVQWADHERFAGDSIRAHDGWESILEHGVHTGTDYLVLVKGWLLLHNPRQGKPILTSGDKPMTKAQREALFDYYTKYGMKKEASDLYREDA